MIDSNRYEKVVTPDQNFPVKLLHYTSAMEEVLFTQHWHEQLELWYIKEGRATVGSTDGEFWLRSRDLFIANSNEIHYAYGMVEYMTLIIDPSFFRTSFAPHGQQYITLKNIVWQNSFVSQRFAVIFQEYSQRNIGFDFIIKSEIYSLLAYLVRNYRDEVFSDREYTSKLKQMNRLNLVFRYLEEHYDEPLNYEFLSTLIHVSPHHFCHIFKTSTGKSLNDYLSDLRIQKACQLLKSQSMTVGEIATQVGISDANYFSRCFKRKIGVSPSEYAQKLHGVGIS